MAEPFYGVDGNLLVEDLPYNHNYVEALLTGTFKPRFWAHQFLGATLWARYPQLVGEYMKRRRVPRQTASAVVREGAVGSAGSSRGNHEAGQRNVPGLKHVLGAADTSRRRHGGALLHQQVQLSRP